MKMFRIIVGAISCIMGLIMVLDAVSMGLSESDLSHDIGAILTVALFSLLGIALITVGAKLMGVK